jgi:hypothetical protein
MICVTESSWNSDSNRFGRTSDSAILGAGKEERVCLLQPENWKENESQAVAWMLRYPRLWRFDLNEHFETDARDKGLVVGRGGTVRHVQVTGTQLPRALSILDALFRAVEERNVRVTWPKE